MVKLYKFFVSAKPTDRFPGLFLVSSLCCDLFGEKVRDFDNVNFRIRMLDVFGECSFCV